MPYRNASWTHCAGFDLARLPIAMMTGAEQTVSYANLAFCQLIGKSPAEVAGLTPADLFPKSDHCLVVLDRVYRTNHAEFHTGQRGELAHSVYWSYDVWPVLNDGDNQLHCLGVFLLITESAPMHRAASAVNEALLISAIRQQEAIEIGRQVNTKLQSEIGDRQRSEAVAEHLAYYDSLTALPNRRLLIDRLNHAIQRSGRTKQLGAVFFLDLDGFKAINDLHGHYFGDFLLQQVAHRFTACLRETDTVGRLGGDEFLLLIDELGDDPGEARLHAAKVGEKLLESLNLAHYVAGKELLCRASIGVSLFGKIREKPEFVIRRADLAQYRTKAAGGAAICFYDLDMEEPVSDRQQLEADLWEGLLREQFVLHYQPQVDEVGGLIGAEALLRWEHPRRGMLLPADFIVLAEESGFIEVIGQWVMTEACMQLVAWSRAPETAGLALAINISAREFSHPEFVSRLLHILEEVGADPRKLVLEFTERVMFGPLKSTLEKMEVLKAKGIRFSLDDFGIGYSSLATLRNLPLDQIKLDRSFIQNVLTDSRDARIVISILALAMDLNVEIIAEGVENQSEFEFLSGNGCSAFQGYHFGRPEPIDGLARFSA